MAKSVLVLLLGSSSSVLLVAVGKCAGTVLMVHIIPPIDYWKILHGVVRSIACDSRGWWRWWWWWRRHTRGVWIGGGGHPPNNDAEPAWIVCFCFLLVRFSHGRTKVVEGAYLDGGDAWWWFIVLNAYRNWFLNYRFEWGLAGTYWLADWRQSDAKLGLIAIYWLLKSRTIGRRIFLSSFPYSQFAVCWMFSFW